MVTVPGPEPPLWLCSAAFQPFFSAGPPSPLVISLPSHNCIYSLLIYAHELYSSITESVFLPRPGADYSHGCLSTPTSFFAHTQLIVKYAIGRMLS